MKRFSFALLLGSVFMLAAASTSSAASRATVDGAKVSVKMSTRVIGPKTKRFKATVTIRTGSKRLRKWIGLYSPQFERQVLGRTFGENYTLRLLDGANAFGSYAYYGSFGSETNMLSGCLPKYPAHGSESNEMGWSLRIGPHKTVRETFAIGVSSANTWSNTDYTPKFTFFDKPVKEAEVPKTGVTLSPRRPRVTRPIASRIEFDVTPAVPATEGPGRWNWFELLHPAGTQLTFSGKLVPAAAGQTVKLSQRFGMTQAFSAAGSAVTDAEGRFSLQWTSPAEAGFLKLDSGSGKRADSACAIGIAPPPA